MKDDHNYEHNDQEPHNYYQHDPPHIHNPLYRLLEANRVQKEVCQAAEYSVVVHDHALIEEVTVAGKIFTGKPRAYRLLKEKRACNCHTVLYT